MKTCSVIAVTLLCFTSTLTGCGSMGTASVDYSARPIDLKADNNDVLKVLDALKGYNVPKEGDKVSDSSSFLTGRLVFDACLTDEKKVCTLNRDRALSILIAASDTACNTHLRSMYGNEAVSNLVLGSLATVFMAASAGVAATSVTAKTNYAVAGTIFSAERSLVNDVIYKSILVPVIHQKILSTRQMKRSNLDKMYGLEYDAYPVERAVSAVVDYHNSCSFMEGLQLALREGSADTQAVRLRALYADAKTQFEAAEKAATKDSAGNVIEGPAYRNAKERFDAYSEALKTAELESARVITDSSKAKEEAIADQKKKNATAAAELEKIKAVNDAVQAVRDQAAAEKLQAAVQAEKDKNEAVNKAVAKALADKASQ